jgi:unsaturated chondroitin disaccharide hydrolase
MLVRLRAILGAVGCLGLVLAVTGVASTPRSADAGAARAAASSRAVVGLELSRRARPAVARTLPPRWAASANVELEDGALVRVTFGPDDRPLTLRPPRRAGALRVEATRKAVAVDGRIVSRRRITGRRLRMQVVRGRARIDALLITHADRPSDLLLHRVAALHARTAPGRSPLATEDGGRVRFARGWTSGFWPGALWQASRIARRPEPFTRWALDATVAHVGDERMDTHDLGFMYGRSSLEAFRRLCPRRADAATCTTLRESALTAAATLRDLAATNAAAGTIPMDSRSENADTIIDSVMNLSLLTWAGRTTGDRAFTDLAARHAHAVAGLLVDPGGATTQSVHTRRADGAVLRRHTHQGAGDDTVWARGQSWAVYGFAEIGRELRDPALVAVSERAARYVAAHLPKGGVPPYDYAAGPDAPIDVSSGVITAAGLYQLDAACRAMPRSCERPSRWASLGSRMLDASLAHASRRPPLGRLGSQVYKLGGREAWMDDAELVFGIDYALEALAARAARR